MLAIEKILEDLKCDRNVITSVIELIENVSQIPQILENQQKILRLLQGEGDDCGSTNEFRQHIIQTVRRLNGLAVRK